MVISLRKLSLFKIAFILISKNEFPAFVVASPMVVKEEGLYKEILLELLANAISFKSGECCLAFRITKEVSVI